MLTKQASAPVRSWKYSLLAPAILFIFFVVRQTPVISQTLDAHRVAQVRDLEAKGWTVQDTVITFDPETYTETTEIKETYRGPKPDASGRLVYDLADRQPEFPGGLEALTAYLQENLVYPPKDLAAKRNGYIIVDFVVNTDGALEAVNAESHSKSSSQAMVDEAVRVIRLSPRWTPAEFKGEKVSCRMKLPIQFRL